MLGYSLVPVLAHDCLKLAGDRRAPYTDYVLRIVYELVTRNIRNNTVDFNMSVYVCSRLTTQKLPNKFSRNFVRCKDM